LIAYSIEAALNCSIIDDCYVTTDDNEIKDVSKLWGAQVIDRPAELATDAALSSDAVAHALHFLKEQGRFPEYFVLLQPTSPLRTAKHLEECLSGFLHSGMKSAVSITEAEHHPWKMLISASQGMQPVKDHHSLESPRQLLPKAYRINGAVYSMSSEIFLQKRSFYIEPAYTYIMSQEDSLDIDSGIDLKIFEMILKGKNFPG
jgi:CMP-N,N'-diacetyllegionaminic acid synthase